MSTPVVVLIVALVIALIAVLFFWMQFRRARESFTHIDRSKLKDLSKDAWEDK